MKKEIVAFLGAVLFLGFIMMALFTDSAPPDVARSAVPDWQPAAFPQPLITINQNDPKPVLVKELGIEVVPIVGGKVKITGVMGKSWADKAGLRKQDIILRFNRKKIKSLEHFKTMIKGVPPEKNYKIKILRSGRVKKKIVMVGEGEMEGFAPMVPVAFMRQNHRMQAHNVCPLNQGKQMHSVNAQRGCTYQCRNCRNTMGLSNPGAYGTVINCPACHHPMNRIQ